MSDGVSEEVSKELLEKELKGIEDAMDELEGRVHDIEDRDMMAQLEAMSLEEEVQEVEELLNHMTKEELEKRLNMVEQIKEEYQEGKVHEKLEYLYQQIKDLRERNLEDSNVSTEYKEQFEERLDELESKIPNKSGGSGMPEKYKKAVRSNYEELKKIKQKIDSIDSGVDSSEGYEQLESRISKLEDLKSKLDRMEDNGEVVFVEDGPEETVERPESTTDRDIDGDVPEDLSYIEFDLKSIKSRLSSMEKEGVSQKLDKTDLRDLRRRIKKLERQENGSKELKAFKNDIEQRVKKTEEKTVTEEELDKEVDELREKIEDRIRQLSSEIDRSVREGEQRLKNLEELVEENVLEDLHSTEEDLSERIDNLTTIILDNQDYLESLETEIDYVEQRVDEKEEFVERQAELPNPTSDITREEFEELKEKVESSDKQSEDRGNIDTLEKKIDNLAEHVISNQEKIHRLQEQISTSQPRKKNSGKDDITIIS